ncbi:hypothetical protein [Nocardia sp. NPDC050710]|uniref:hypothetical protein n=1 Tax=Nocardia sp. NPDC050710 TaxID=3157220 RepID=UPI00340B2BD8
MDQFFTGRFGAVDSTAGPASRQPTNECSALTLASEITQYRGWLEHAIGAAATARRTLGAAVSFAEEARDPDRLAHSLGFLGYVTVSAGNYGEVLALSDAALSVRDAHPVVNAYGRMRRAELLAAHGAKREAQHSLILADSASEAADGIEPPPSMYMPAEHRGTEWLASALRRVDPDMVDA